MSEDVMRAAFSDPLLRDMVANALADAAPNDALTAAGADVSEIAVRHWALATEMGWTASLVSAEAGGLGLGLPHIADICEQMGRHLFCGPFIETAVLLPVLARELGGSFARLLPAIMSGEVRAAIVEADTADTEAGARSMTPVEHAAAATHLVALSGQEAGGRQVVLLDMAGAEMDLLQPMDPTTPVGRVDIADLSRLEQHVLEEAAARKVLAAMHVATAADLLGTGEASLARTVEHARNRKQFGQPLGSFQSVKHRLADAYTALACARLAIAHAASREDDFEAAVLARVLAAEAALKAAGDAIQFHGGSGFSWEMALHFYLKRARRLNARNGGTVYLRRSAGDAFIATTLARSGLAA